MDTIYNRLGINRSNNDKSINLYDYMSSMKNNKIFFERVELKNAINGLVDSKYKASGESFGDRVRSVGSNIMRIIRNIINRIMEFFVKVKNFFIEKVLRRKVQKAENNNEKIKKTKTFPITIKVHKDLVIEDGKRGDDNVTVKLIADTVELLDRSSDVVMSVMAAFADLVDKRNNKNDPPKVKSSILNVDINVLVNNFKNIIQKFDIFNKGFKEESNLREIVLEDKGTLMAYVKYSDELLTTVKRAIDDVNENTNALSDNMKKMNHVVKLFSLDKEGFIDDSSSAALRKMKDILSVVSTNVTEIYNDTMKILNTTVDKVTIWNVEVKNVEKEYADVQ